MIHIGLLLAASALDPDPRCGSTQTSDLVACANAELSRQETMLDELWHQAQESAAAQDKDVDAETRAGNGNVTFSQALLASQNAWLAYRDAQCRFDTYLNFMGRELPIYQAGCRTTLTRRRIEELEHFLRGQ